MNGALQNGVQAQALRSDAKRSEDNSIAYI